MGKLDHLKIHKAPACFAEWARNFNHQVDLLASIQGGPGIDVSVAHSKPKLAPVPAGQHRPREQPRGKILLTLRPSAVSGIGVSGDASNYTPPNGTASVVSASGFLTVIQNVNTVDATTQFPSLLKVGNNSATTYHDENSFTSTDGTNTANIGFAGLSIATATKSLSIPKADITHNMGVMTFVGCNSGNAANYLAIASDFF